MRGYPSSGRFQHLFLRGLFFIAVFLLLSYALMFLWNKLLPPIAHVNQINYAQALGLVLLSRILFGGFNLGWMFRGRQGGPPGDLKDKLMTMDNHDRAAFKEEWRKRCATRDEKS